MQPDQRDQELQSNGADVGDVEVACSMHPAAFGEKRSQKNGISDTLVDWIGEAANTCK